MWNNLPWPTAAVIQPSRLFSLKSASRFRTGGLADLYFMISSFDQLQALLRGLPRQCPMHVVGHGSNTLFRDGGLHGAVLRLIGNFQACRIDGTRIYAAGGCSNRKIARMAMLDQLSGVEFLDGIPGSIGGSLKMNAGAFGGDVGSVCVEATVITRDCKTIVLRYDDLQFGYRKSNLPEDSIVIGVVLATSLSERCKIRASLLKMDTERRSYQPVSANTCGSAFKNPPGLSARQLIVAAGMSHTQVGNARLSELNRNFIVAESGCTSTDIEVLGELVRTGVKTSLGVTLDWEICIVGHHAS